MTTKRLKTLALIATVLCTLACNDDVQPEGGAVIGEGQTALVLSTGMSGLNMSAETKAIDHPGAWIQEAIGMTNVAIALFDHDSGQKVFSGVKYPFKTISTSEPYQIAWMLGNFTPEASKTYDLAFACNFPKVSELNAFLNTATWSELVEHEPEKPTFQLPRTDMSNPTQVANAAGENEKWPMVTGYSAYFPKDGGKMYVNQWRSPTLSGYIQGIKLENGKLNLVGFQKDAINDYSPAVDVEAINADLKTSYTAATLPERGDASGGETDNTKRVLTIAPCYALLVVDEIVNQTGGRLEVTDIFMMNVPMYHHLFADKTYHFGASPESFKKTIGAVAYSRGKDLVSGFKPSWIDNAFKTNTKEDNFARLLHYPADGQVSQHDFIEQYGTTETDESSKYKYFFRLYGSNDIFSNGEMLDRMCVTKMPAGGTEATYPDDFTAHLSGNWDFVQTNFPLAYVTKDVRKAPFFLLSENLGDYPNEETVDENGDRQYLFATRLVIRGKWKETPESAPEIVYYPIIVNGPNQNYEAEYAGDSQEKERNFVHRGRRYIYKITIQSKGVYNPWTAARVPVKLASLELKIIMWSYSNVEIPKYIY